MPNESDLKDNSPADADRKCSCHSGRSRKDASCPTHVGLCAPGRTARPVAAWPICQISSRCNQGIRGREMTCQNLIDGSALNHGWSTTGRSSGVHKKRHQRPKVRSLGSKWKLSYWDYTSGKARKRTKVWSKYEIRSQREAQSLADQFMVEVNSRNNQPEIMLVVLDTVKRYMNPVKGSRGHTSKTQRKDNMNTFSRPTSCRDGAKQN